MVQFNEFHAHKLLVSHDGPHEKGITLHIILVA